MQYKASKTTQVSWLFMLLYELKQLLVVLLWLLMTKSLKTPVNYSVKFLVFNFVGVDFLVPKKWSPPWKSACIRGWSCTLLKHEFLNSYRKTRLQTALFYIFHWFLLVLLLCFIHTKGYKLERLNWIIPQTEIYKYNEDAITLLHSW